MASEIGGEMTLSDELDTQKWITFPILFRFCGSWWINDRDLIIPRHCGVGWSWMFVPQMGVSRRKIPGARAIEVHRFTSDLTFTNGWLLFQLSGRIVVHVSSHTSIKDPFLQKKKCRGWWKTMLFFFAVLRSAKKFHLACFDGILGSRFRLKNVEPWSYNKLVADRNHPGPSCWSTLIHMKLNYRGNWNLQFQFHYVLSIDVPECVCLTSNPQPLFCEILRFSEFSVKSPPTKMQKNCDQIAGGQQPAMERQDFHLSKTFMTWLTWYTGMSCRYLGSMD